MDLAALAHFVGVAVEQQAAVEIVVVVVEVADVEYSPDSDIVDIADFVAVDIVVVVADIVVVG